MDHLIQHIESLIFAADNPVSEEEIQKCLESLYDIKIDGKVIREALEALIGRYRDEVFSMEIVAIAGGYQFLSKGAYHKTVGHYLKITSQKKLSRAALETLAIIAYRQPVTKSDVEKIRGVSCDYSIQKLLEKELVSILGRSDGPGRPLLYGTSQKFMDYFGLKSVKDLPKLKDFKDPENTVGEKAPIEEDAEDRESN